jgi:tetratricopeptide (TPR) repeat protein
MKLVAGLVAVLLMSVSPAFADGIADAFDAGRFAEAAALARAEGGADNLAIAARALLAETMVSGRVDKAKIEEAEGLAKQALALEPDHGDARLQLAIALSMLARDMSRGEALDSGHASQARDLVQAVLEDEPDNAYAHGFMAVWNVEVVRRGGSMGSAFMGASMRKARDHYRAALVHGGVDPSFDWQYARALAAHNARKYRKEIEACLSRAAAAAPKTALSSVMQARARDFEAYMTTHSRRDIERMAASLL